VITKQIFHYFDSNFPLEITSELENIGQQLTFTYKLTTNRNFQTASFFFLLQNGKHMIVRYRRQRRIHMLPSKIYQMKVSQETWS